MQRRSFLKYLGIGAAAAPLIPLVAKLPKGSVIGPPPAADSARLITAKEIWPGIQKWCGKAYPGGPPFWPDPRGIYKNENPPT